MRLLRFIRLLPIKFRLLKPMQTRASAPLRANPARLNDDILIHLDGYKDHLSRCYAVQSDRPVRPKPMTHETL